MKTIVRGDTAVLAVALALAKRGERILLPFSAGERYDIALDRRGVLYRIQCKSGHLFKGAVCFKTSSHGPRVAQRRYDGEIEAFGVYCREIDRCFLVPIESVSGLYTAKLRIQTKLGGHQRTVRPADVFAI